MTHARIGVWTPWAQILCVECDYAALKDSPRANHYARHVAAVATMDRTAEIPRPDGDAMGTCQTCGASCWVRFDVGLLQQVGLTSSDLDWEGPFGWEMHQTGGMCAALVFSNDTHQVVVTAMDGFFVVGTYLASDQGWEDPVGGRWESPPLYNGDENLPEEQISALVKECASKAIEFIRATVKSS